MPGSAKHASKGLNQLISVGNMQECFNGGNDSFPPGVPAGSHSGGRSLPRLWPSRSLKCPAVQCSVVQCSAVQWCAVQCRALSCVAVQCPEVSCSAVLCSAVQCPEVSCSAFLCSAVWCNTVEYSVLRCSAGQFSAGQGRAGQ